MQNQKSKGEAVATQESGIEIVILYCIMICSRYFSNLAYLEKDSMVSVLPV